MFFFCDILQAMSSFTPARQSRALPDPMIPKGRGAKSNTAGRFEPTVTEPFDDGWSRDEKETSQTPTTLIRDKSRTIIATNSSPDISFNRSINPYRGCEHGCIYCYARPTHAYWGYSAGIDFETKLFYKPDAASLLEREFRKPGYSVETIALGTNTDPYQPIEKRLRITRSILELCLRFKHPVGIVTKSAGVLRDIDILSKLARMGLTKVAISITTLDRKLARSMEPRASTPQKRLDAIGQLTKAGVPTVLMTAPILPGLTDHEIETLIEKGAEAGAISSAYVLLRLPLEIKHLFSEWLEAERPDAAEKVLSLVRQMRGGKLYDSTFNKRGRGEGPIADLIAQRHAKACERYGLTAPRKPLRNDLFERPLETEEQLSLF